MVNYFIQKAQPAFNLNFNLPVNHNQGFRGLEPPLFLTVNAFEWGHIAGTPFFILGCEPFLKWLDLSLHRIGNIHPPYNLQRCIKIEALEIMVYICVKLKDCGCHVWQCTILLDLLSHHANDARKVCVYPASHCR